MIRVKICGLNHLEAVRVAIEAGADVLGFVHEKSSPRYIGDDLPGWLSELPPFPPKVAVFGHVDRGVMKGIFDFVQGVEWTVLQEPFPKRIHTLRIRPGQVAADFTAQIVKTGALLLDAHADGAYGGTGKRVDWNVAAEIVQRSDRPVILAGGLTPDNVADAVRRVRPYAVDVSSGVESALGVKDYGKIRAFIEAAKGA